MALSTMAHAPWTILSSRAAIASGLADAVKVGRRASRATNSVLARPHPDGGEHCGTLAPCRGRLRPPVCSRAKRIMRVTETSLVLGGQHVIVDGAERTVRTMLHPIVEGLDDIVLEVIAARVRRDHRFALGVSKLLIGDPQHVHLDANVAFWVIKGQKTCQQQQRRCSFRQRPWRPLKRRLGACLSIRRILLAKEVRVGFFWLHEQDIPCVEDR
jgi:hypothetical protein